MINLFKDLKPLNKKDKETNQQTSSWRAWFLFTSFMFIMIGLDYYSFHLFCDEAHYVYHSTLLIFRVKIKCLSFV